MRILIVDDDTLNRFLLVHMLEQQGYMDTFEAENGAVALELAKRVQPDLVLLDVVMPEIDGYEVARRLKKMAGDIYLPIIFITGLDDEASLANCLEAGGDDFVGKPFDKVILSAKIRAHARTRLLSKKADEQNKQLSFYRNAVEREHKIVEHIFSNALAIDDFYSQYIDYCLTPASDFNGDLFLTAASPTGGLFFLVGDFTGHGLASAIGALPVAQAFQTMARKGLSLMEMAGTINQTMLLLLPDEMFFAAAIVEISSNGKQIDIWNGGMPDLLLQDNQGQLIKRFESRHMALGVLEKHEFDFEVERHELNYGERLIAMSDGLLEIENPKGEMLCETGLDKWFEEKPDINVQQLLGKVEQYIECGERMDDVTIVIYTCQNLDVVSDKTDASKLPVKLTSDIPLAYIKSSDPIDELVNIITNQLGLYGVHSELFTILSELYNNSLDHGLLKLDSSLKDSDDGFFEYFDLRQERLSALEDAKIEIAIEYLPDQKSLHIRMVDSGEGFDQESLTKVADVEKSYGKGIALIKELCDTVQYSNNGNTVDVVFKL